MTDPSLPMTQDSIADDFDPWEQCSGCEAPLSVEVEHPSVEVHFGLSSAYQDEIDNPNEIFNHMFCESCSAVVRSFFREPAWAKRLVRNSQPDLAAQVAQARRETLKEVADTLIATAQVYREQGDAKTARVLEIVAQLYPDALATPEAGNE